jgi:uncharacterized protein (DUF1778 family)
MRAALGRDAARFLDLLDAPQAGPDELRAAASRVLAEAERLLAALAGADR